MEHFLEVLTLWNFFLQAVSQIESVSEEKRFGTDSKLVFFQNLGASRFIIWYELINLV